MRISSISITKWRNLAGITLELPPDADFLCLVGENGSGKSHLLDLLHFAAQQLGLTPDLSAKRQPPLASEEPYDIAVTLSLTPNAAIYATSVPAELRTALKTWDGQLMLESAGVERDSPNSPVSRPAHASASTSPTYASWSRVMALNTPSEQEGVLLANHIVEQLRQGPAVLHLYIDSERVFPPLKVKDEEILRVAQQDFDAPQWVRKQAARVTQNLYLEWMRAMLGQQQKMQSNYFQLAQKAKRAGETPPLPEDFLEHYRDTLQSVLPHLEFQRLDQEQKRLIYDSAGHELAYEDLSGGEKELAFLVGQIERFGVSNGLFLLDEPELHLNVQLLRGWLSYLKGSVEAGQVWIATHTLEAAETAGLQTTLVLERDEDRTVRTITPLGDRPALATLAGQLGSPAFSLASSRFLLIEGTRPGRERERFARVLNGAPTDRFLESGGCNEVLEKLDAMRHVASEAEQLRVGGFIDRDFRTDEAAGLLTEQHGVCVLPVHEIENFFLHPEALAAIAKQAGIEPTQAWQLLVNVTDHTAGVWLLEKIRLQNNWQADVGAARELVQTLDWSLIAADPKDVAERVMNRIADQEAKEKLQHRNQFTSAVKEYERLRTEPELLWKYCFGKESLRGVAPRLGMRDAEALEDRVAELWREDSVARPVEVESMRSYLDAIPVLT